MYLTHEWDNPEGGAVERGVAWRGRLLWLRLSRRCTAVCTAVGHCGCHSRDGCDGGQLRCNGDCGGLVERGATHASLKGTEQGGEMLKGRVERGSRVPIRAAARGLPGVGSQAEQLWHPSQPSGTSS